jgi:8-oxo-dGTP pyrophosphatase MutT (NUDIX family)
MMQPLTRQNVRLAATIVLIRDAVEGMQVFMMQRPGAGDFPDLHVFPGGKVDEQDLLPDPEHVAGLTDRDASAALGVKAGGLRYWVAAIRECFEECGVLLATRSGRPVDFADPVTAARFDGYRHALIDQTLSMSALCDREELVLCCDQVRYFSHWITPEMAPRRFDTRFFVARMPPSQTTLAHARETADNAWIEPDRALEAHTAGSWQMISPTLTTLASIAGFTDTAAALAAVAAEAHLPPLTAALREQGMHPLR